MSCRPLPTQFRVETTTNQKSSSLFSAFACDKRAEEELLELYKTIYTKKLS